MSTILIVDDEPRICEILSRTISAAGHATTSAPDAETALAAVDAQRPDVVLCDVHMPGLSGLWLIDQLRDRHPSIPIVLVTGNAQIPPVVTFRSGIVDYVVKPFGGDRVIGAVNRALERRVSAGEHPAAEAGDTIEDWLRRRR